MPKVVATRRTGFAHDLDLDGGHTLTVDEPDGLGGTDQGPSPVRLVAAALASCTAITIEMYTDRKGWDLGTCEVTTEYEPDERGGTGHFDVVVHLPGGLTEEQTSRIMKVAAKCPVHRLLAGEAEVTLTETTLPG